MTALRRRQLQATTKPGAPALSREPERDPKGASGPLRHSGDLSMQADTVAPEVAASPVIVFGLALQLRGCVEVGLTG